MRIPGWAALFLVLAVPAARAQVRLGPEFQVNTFTTSNQPMDAASIAADALGNFVVAWDSSQGGADSEVLLQRYDASGAPRGGEFTVNTYTTGHQWWPSVASDATGNFVVAWTQDRPPSVIGDIVAQRFDREGARRGLPFAVSTITTALHGAPFVASDPAGNFLVVWAYGETGAPEREVYGRAFDREGLPRGPEFRVNTYTTGLQFGVTAAADAGGNFVVIWDSIGQDGASGGIFGQRLTASGLPAGAEFRVNTYTTDNQQDAFVDAAADGRIVVTWESFGQDGDGKGIYAQRYDASGAPAGGEFRVNSSTVSHQAWPRVAVDANANFVVTWDDAAAGARDVFGRRFDASGAPRGAEFAVNLYTTGGQAAAEVVADGAGNFVVAWNDYTGRDGSGNGIFAQRFGGVTPGPTTVDPAGNGVLEPAETVAVQTAWRNVSGTTQAFTGTASQFTGPGAPNNPTYTILDGAADYGVVPDGALASCAATNNCYVFSIGPVTAAPTARPALHWDATFREDIHPDTLGESLTRRLHVGDSFLDVPRASGFYRFVEIILHHGLTGGCGGGNFCPAQSTPREQMAVFVLLAKEGASYVPPACVAGAERFGDVPASSPFCRWIEEMERRGIIGGCGGGNFCPLGTVTREQMAVFALATREPAGYTPPACVAGAERFADVPASSPFCRWIEEMERRGIVGGCGGGNFCPVQAVTREQNSVFVSGTFGLTLY